MTSSLHHRSGPAPHYHQHYDGAPSDVEAGEPLAKVVPSPEHGLSVIFLAESPPPSPTPESQSCSDHQPSRYPPPSSSHGINTCIIPVTHTKAVVAPVRREVNNQAVPMRRKKRYSSNQGLSCCVIPVVSGRRIGDYEVDKAGESTNGWRDHICELYTCDTGNSQQPSARIVLKGSIAFTHDEMGSEEEVCRLHEDCHLTQGTVVDEIYKTSCSDYDYDSSRMLTSSPGFYLESYLPEPPPRRRRSRTRFSSDSAIFVGGDGGDSEDLQSVTGDYPGEEHCSTSLVITFGYGQEDDDEGLPVLSEPTDTEDDSVFAGDVQESRAGSLGGSDARATSGSTSKRYYTASEFIRDTILAPVDKPSVSSFTQAKQTSFPLYVNVPKQQLTDLKDRNTSQKEASEINDKRDSVKSETSRKDKDRQIVNIEFITRELPLPEEGAAPPPTPPPRTKSPTKNRARSSSPRKSSTPEDQPSPRRWRSCCLHQEYLRERGRSPTSLLESFFESSALDSDLEPLQSDFRFCHLYQVSVITILYIDCSISI